MMIIANLYQIINQIINKKSKKDLIISHLKTLDLTAINKAALNEWLEYKKFNYQATGINKLLKLLSNCDKETQQQMVDQSIMNNYAGLFEVNKQKQNNFQLYETVAQRNNRLIEEACGDIFPGDEMIAGDVIDCEVMQ